MNGRTEASCGEEGARAMRGTSREFPRWHEPANGVVSNCVGGSPSACISLRCVVTLTNDQVGNMPAPAA
jgi:hypothetical protein